MGTAILLVQVERRPNLDTRMPYVICCALAAYIRRKLLSTKPDCYPILEGCEVEEWTEILLV